jgi:hypothetical protein
MITEQMRRERPQIEGALGAEKSGERCSQGGGGEEED